MPRSSEPGAPNRARGLRQDDNQRVAEGFFLDKLRGDFGEWAEVQLEIAAAWGRFSELFAFDAASGELFLEAPN